MHELYVFKTKEIKTKNDCKNKNKQQRIEKQKFLRSYEKKENSKLRLIGH